MPIVPDGTSEPAERRDLDTPDISSCSLSIAEDAGESGAHSLSTNRPPGVGWAKKKQQYKGSYYKLFSTEKK